MAWVDSPEPMNIQLIYAAITIISKCYPHIGFVALYFWRAQNLNIQEQIVTFRITAKN